jgi:Domain of Unknown Function (DUF326)
MTYAAPLAHAHPSPPSVEVNALVECIQACYDCAQACYDCAQACTADADADRGAPQVQAMVRCIRLCLDCADVCLTTGRILSRQTAFDFSTARATIQTWLQVCKVCGDECQQHAQRGCAHCQTCLQACRRCEEACHTLLALLPGSTRSAFDGGRPAQRGTCICGRHTAFAG